MISDVIIQLSTEAFLQSVLCETATTAAMVVAYATDSNTAEDGSYKSGWTSEFAREKLNEVWRDKGTSMRRSRDRRITIAELRELSALELRALGFIPWNETMTAIPLWAWNYIADGEKLICIDGSEAVKGVDDIDLDVRAGCLSYGFAPPSPVIGE